jgi:hypothetical protein
MVTKDHQSPQLKDLQAWQACFLIELTWVVAVAQCRSCQAASVPVKRHQAVGQSVASGDVATKVIDVVANDITVVIKLSHHWFSLRLDELVKQLTGQRATVAQKASLVARLRALIAHELQRHSAAVQNCVRVRVVAHQTNLCLWHDSQPAAASLRTKLSELMRSLVSKR